MSNSEMQATFDALGARAADFQKERCFVQANPRSWFPGRIEIACTMGPPLRRAMEDISAEVLALEIHRLSSSREPRGTDGGEGLDEFEDDREWLREFD